MNAFASLKSDNNKSLLKSQVKHFFVYSSLMYIIVKQLENKRNEAD